MLSGRSRSRPQIQLKPDQVNFALTEGKPIWPC